MKRGREEDSEVVDTTTTKRTSVELGVNESKESEEQQLGVEGLSDADYRKLVKEEWKTNSRCS
jgi:hypothetical protein